MGTGYGIQSPAAGLGIVEQAEISEHAKQKILSGNIERILEIC